MTGTVQEFTVDLRKFTDQFKVGVEKIVKKAAVDLHSKVVMTTPVDTGRARGSWNIQSNTPDNSNLPPAPEDYAPFPGAYPFYDADVALSRSAGLPDAQTYHVTNTVPYIEELEYGKSRQAPAGMARIAIAEVVSELKSTFR